MSLYRMPPSQARLVPTLPAHSASFMGEVICLSVALNGAKVSISTHTNAYVGNLRQQVRKRCLDADFNPHHDLNLQQLWSC